MTRTVRFLRLLPAIAITVLWLNPVAAQTFPTKPVRFIVPWPPGGTSDVLLRPVTVKLTETWGQQVLLDNRGGASGIIGTNAAARSAPDGYTLLMAGSPLYINPSLYPKLPYDPVKDFAPITILALVPNVVAVHPSVPVRSVKELVALAKARPGQLNFTGSGNATPGHLAGELFKTMAGIDMVHIPYKGGGASVMATIAGEVSVIITTTGGVVPQARAGRLRVVAVTTRERIPELPDTPTVAESGLQSYEAVSWYGILTPTGISAELLGRLQKDILEALRSEEVRTTILRAGAIPVGNSPDEFRTRIVQDTEKWKKVIDISGARVE